MDFATFLRGILHCKALVLRSDDGTIVLREKKVMSIKVNETPLQIAAINLHRIGSLSGVRDGEWKQACDYLLVCDEESRHVAVFIELKKTIYGDGKPAVQLRWSLPIYRYLCAMYALHSASQFMSAKALVRYYIIATKYNRRLDKQGVKPQPGVIHKETYKDVEIHTYVGTQIPFSLLVRGKRKGSVAA